MWTTNVDQEIFIHVHVNRRVLNQILQNKNFVVRGWVTCFATTDFPNAPTHHPPLILIDQNNRIFMFVINPPRGNVRIQKLIAKHIFECFEKRKGEDGKVNTQGLLSP